MNKPVGFRYLLCYMDDGTKEARSYGNLIMSESVMCLKAALHEDVCCIEAKHNCN